MKQSAICIILSLLCLCACEKVLDTKVTWHIEDEDTWRVPQLAQGVLHKAYSAISNRPDCYNNNFLDCATDNALTNAYDSPVYNLALGGMTSYSNQIGNWATAYNVLNYINAFLEKGLTDELQYNLANPEVDKQIKRRLEGEAYFLRAWWHFELLKVYGGKASNGKALGVPIADQFFSMEEAAQDGEFIRPTYQAVVDFIINDLDKAMELLPSEYAGDDLQFGSTHIGRANKYAAAVLKSRVLVYNASPAMQDDDVVRIVEMGRYEIVNSALYEAKWAYAAKEIAKLMNIDGLGSYVATTSSSLADVSSESTDFAFRKYFNTNNLEGFHFPAYYYGQARTSPSHNLVKAYPAKNGFPLSDPRSGIDISDPECDMMQVYAVLDNRFAQTVYYHSAVFGDSGIPLDMSDGGKDSQTYAEKSSRTGYYLAKFVSKKSSLLLPTNKINSAHYNPLLKKSELLINFAEAANEAWENPKVKQEGCRYSAYDIMKTIRMQAGGIDFDLYLDEISDDKAAFRSLIQNERRLEFAFENHRYFDMRRWLLPLNEAVEGVEVIRKADGTFDFKVKVIEERRFEIKNYYAPLPYSELQKNKNLINNMGWN